MGSDWSSTKGEIAQGGVTPRESAKPRYPKQTQHAPRKWGPSRHKEGRLESHSCHLEAQLKSCSPWKCTILLSSTFHLHRPPGWGLAAVIPTQLLRASGEHKERARNDQDLQGEMIWALIWARACVRENAHVQLIQNCFQTTDTLKRAHRAEPQVLAVVVLQQGWDVAEGGLVSPSAHPFVPLSLMKTDIEREAGTLCQGWH